eukprot:TRINITY_DN10333_c0_g4_i1.p1 TRINITY_DN10333_c0_g4~~TRINITY_DN10333_c0_g4_i1.p1  ORF type:complete len:410 (+),score=124.87 TRINITY_DN10333_c0_g4_i1:78-1232(+)
MDSIGKFVRQVLHLESAEDYKRRIDADISKLEEEASEHHGKSDQAVRSATGKYISTLRQEPRYIDACRVVKGLAPAHGFFTGEPRSQAQSSSEEPLDAETAEKLAREAEQALQELEPEPEKKSKGPALGPDGLPVDVEGYLRSLSERAHVLEKKGKEGSANASTEDIEELENLAQEVVDYKAKLRAACGYTNTDFKSDETLHKLEHRLDAISRDLLPGESNKVTAKGEAGVTSEDLQAVANNLKTREKALLLQFVKHHENSGLSPSEAQEVSKLFVEIAELKAKLRTEGLSESEQDKDEEVLNRLLRLSELRMKEQHDERKHAKTRSKELAGDMEEMENLRTEVHKLKRLLQAECGYTHKEIKQDATISELEERLAVLKKFGGA